MFKPLIDGNFDAELRADAEPYIIQDRQTYDEVIMHILHFTREKQMMISNIDLLLGKHKYWNYVEAYTLNVDEISRNLVLSLCEKFKKTFLLKISDMNKEYYIEYNLRKICLLNAINPYKNLTIYDFISPSHYRINEELTIYLLPFLVEVINLYKILYDPGFASDWEDTYRDIKIIEIHVDKEIEAVLATSDKNGQKILSTTGGEPKAKPTPTPCKIARENYITDLKKLLRDFALDDKYIFLEYDPEDIIQIISPHADKDHELLINFFARVTKFAITIKKKKIYLPKESRLEKYHYYIEMPCVTRTKKKHFLTIYNNTSYELIHYTELHGIKIAEPSVRLRFKYLNLWFNIIAQKTHGLHLAEFLKFVKKTKGEIKKLRGEIRIYDKKKNYIGSYISADIAKKMAMIIDSKKKSFYCRDFII